MSAANLELPSVMDSDGKGVDAKHEEWIARHRAYFFIDLLARCGYEIKAAAAQVLWMKPKEPTDVYSARAETLNPQNLLGTGLAYYTAAMFREEWMATFRRGGAPIEKAPATDFFMGDAGWMKNVDRRGTGFSDFLAALFEGVLKFQRMWVLTDKPRSNPSQFRNWFEQKAEVGSLDPYVVLYDGRNVINWDEDDQGNLNWVVIWVPKIERKFKQGAKTVDYWLYYDRQNYEIYRAERKGGASQPDGSKAVVIESGPHALSEFGRVPLRRCEVPELFWLGNRGYPLALEHLNQAATYSWALKMANLPVPYIEGEYDEPPTVSTTELVVLPSGTKFGWMEANGNSFVHAALKIASDREECYRMLYLQAQGKDASATASQMSGVSKEVDYRPVAEVLSKYAAWLRGGGEGILRDVADARGDKDLTASVSGTDFEEADVDGSLATLKLLDDANIPSDTLEKVVQKEAAMKLARDESEEVQKAIMAEIDAAPKKSEREAQQQQLASQQFANALTTGINRSVESKVVGDVKQAA